MFTGQTWIFNRYQMGNIVEVLAYADVAADIEKQGIKLPNMASTGLKASEMKQLGINQLNYMFGVNPWDVSFVYGVGDKNDAHPHHRAANPEGRNTSDNYKYACPTGALFGGVFPGVVNSLVPDNMSWEDYHKSETCLSASTVLLSALTIVSNGGNDYYTTGINSNQDQTYRQGKNSRGFTRLIDPQPDAILPPRVFRDSYKIRGTVNAKGAHVNETNKAHYQVDFNY